MQLPTNVVPLAYGGCNGEFTGQLIWTSIRNGFTAERGWPLVQSSDGHAAFTPFNRQCAGWTELPDDEWVREDVRQLPPITKIWDMGGGFSVYHEKADLYLWHGSTIEPEHLQRALVKAPVVSSAPTYYLPDDGSSQMLQTNIDFQTSQFVFLCLRNMFDRTCSLPYFPNHSERPYATIFGAMFNTIVGFQSHQHLDMPIVK